MQKSQIDSATLVLAAAVAALGITQLLGEFAWMGSIAGLLALLVLFAFDRKGHRTAFQSLAFSAVCGFCAAVASGIIYKQMASEGEVHLANSRWVTEYLPLTCAFATAIFWAIDLMRMNARKVMPIHVPRALGETSILPTATGPIQAPTPPPPFTFTSSPAAPPVVPQRFEMPAAAMQPPPAPPPPSQPVTTASVPLTPEPPPGPSEVATATSMFGATSPEPQPQAQPLNPGPVPIIPRSGKETLIYISLLGEGLNVLRSVRAEPLGRDYYRIIDEVPAGETWQFQPGQVVRCRKQKLSTGKAMVAFEEAPRST
jgi:hypothetical protein